MSENYKFMQHKECEYFPCHETSKPEDFNCLFCYCPLYALGTKCGGNYNLMPGGFKDCTNCMVPHVRSNYEHVIGRFQDIVELTKQQCLDELEKTE